MKKVLMLGVVLLLVLGTVALAEPIDWAYDSAPVNLNVAPWVYIYFVNGENAEFYIDVEAGEEGASDVEEIVAGHNCNALVTGVLIPPPGAPGQWSWYFIGDGHALYLPGAGEYFGRVKVRVSGITINDPAGFYPGGTMVIHIGCLD